MRQKFVQKIGSTGSIRDDSILIEEVVKRMAENPFLDRQLDSMIQVMGAFAAVLSEGQQVRLAELLHHVPVAVPFEGKAPESPSN